MSRTVELKPIKEASGDYLEIEQNLIQLWKTQIYLPLMKILGTSQLKNAMRNSLEDVIDAVNSGRITFHHGKFTGRFSARVSKELKNLGAYWDDGWRISRALLPLPLREAIDTSRTKMLRTTTRIYEKLSSIIPAEVADQANLEKLFDTTLWKVDKDFRLSVKGITVAPELSKEQRERIAREYTQDLKRYIKDWTEKEILTLRKLVADKVMKGERHESFVTMVERRFGVSQSKAKFLARQETALMMAKFKETRYASAGVREYKWGCVAGTSLHPVRPAHKKLEGKIFRFDDPPITTGPGEAVRRNNPGEDFNCRCFARPIVRFAA